MRSIRAQLLGWLLPGFVIVCVAAGAGVYFLARQAFEADLDARLGKLAGGARLALRTQIVGGASGTRGPTMKTFLAKEEFQTPGQYFEQWTATPATEWKSPNLGDVELPRPAEFTREAVSYDCTLENKDRVRVSAMRSTQDGAAKPVDFAVALSRRGVDARLSRLIIELVIGGIACCAVLCGLLVVASRFSMRPLAQLGEQAAAMGAESLHERFTTEAMPSEITPIVTRLNDLIARLEQSFERERRFSGDLAHELRTPLAAIRATSEVAAKWPEQSSSDDFHEIAQSAARLQQTVDSLLVLSRLETASADVISETVALGPLVDECLALHIDRAKQRDLKFDLRLDPSPTLETDPRLLRIIITNLIANATEYAPPGSEIVIAATDSAPFLCITNLAPDLTPEDIPRLYDRLWRKDASRSDSAHAGLGLSIASSCAVALGLTLKAELDGSDVLHMSLHREK